MKANPIPRRIRKLNKIYATHGGVRDYVLDQLESGSKYAHVAAELSRACGETIPCFTLYDWVRKWKRAQQETPATPVA